MTVVPVDVAATGSVSAECSVEVIDEVDAAVCVKVPSVLYCVVSDVVCVVCVVRVD